MTTPKMAGRHAEIAGAGFAGLVAAAALARQGWSVRIHEAAPAPRSVGSGIYVFPFAQEALRKVGALERVRRDAWAPAQRLIMIDGERRSVTPLSGLLTTTRAALHEALLATARETGAVLVTGSTAVGADGGTRGQGGGPRDGRGNGRGDGRGALLLADGTRAKADLVVAADGVRSAVAEGAGMTLRRTRHADGITRILLDRGDMRSGDWDGIIDAYDYRHRPLRVLYTPCGRDAFYLCLMAPVDDAGAAAVPIDAALWSRSFPLLAPALARAGSLGRHDRYATTELRRWSSGCLAVVGDAAHAMPSSLGQGAGVSMMNALAMAEAAAAADACGAGVPAGLACWEAEMRPVVERWQRQAEQVASERSLSSARHPGFDLAAEARTPLEAA